jgi:hypothetical protein
MLLTDWPLMALSFMVKGAQAETYAECDGDGDDIVVVVVVVVIYQFGNRKRRRGFRGVVDVGA